MQDLTASFVELIRRTSTDLSPDVEKALVAARAREAPGSGARGALDTILKNIDIARHESTPICQDTGVPLFFVKHPAGYSTRALQAQIRAAVAEATKRSYLRPNAVDSITDKNSGNNVGDEAFPTIHFEEIDGDEMAVDLMLKGGGSENVGCQYSVPYGPLNAGRDLKGVRKVVLDAVQKAQGQGCSPGVLGIAVGADRSSSYAASKEALLRRLEDTNPDPKLAALEQQLTADANQLGIGPMGFGGNTTVLGAKIKGMYRHPACYFVTVSYMCWAYRHRSMSIRGDKVIFS